MIVDVVIPAYNEQGAIGNVIDDIPKNLVRHIIVVDNNSSDKTADIARSSGAVVLQENNKGYGFACLKGIDYLKSQSTQPDLVVFLDGDYSDFPAQMEQLIDPFTKANVDMVIGSRSLGNKTKKAMPSVPLNARITTVNTSAIFFQSFLFNFETKDCLNN